MQEKPDAGEATLVTLLCGTSKPGSFLYFQDFGVFTELQVHSSR